MPKQTVNIIIGGTGTIGSALAERLIKDREEVVSISRNIPERKIRGVKYNYIDFYLKPEMLPDVLGTQNTIYILIGQNHPNFNMGLEQISFMNLLTEIKNSTPQKIIFTSSVLVYGECKKPANEERAVCPTDDYSKYKSWCEKQIANIFSEIPFGIIRLANIYGSKSDKGIIQLLLSRIAEHLTISINGDGLQERDYIFITDVVFAILAIRNKLQQSDIVNVSTGKSKTLLELISIISQVSGNDIPYTTTNTLNEETRVSRVDNSKLIDKYGYTPSIDLETGIRKKFDLFVKE